jgi:hypothetical protein
MATLADARQAMDRAIQDGKRTCATRREVLGYWF